MLWPSNNRGATAYLGGVKVGNYLKVFDGANGYKSMVPQKINTGVLCHEMTHTLGAYDLYTTKGNANSTLEPVNVWDLMSDNQTVPRGLTAYMRMQYGSPFGGWLPRTDIKQISQNGRYTLRPLSSETPDDVAFIIRPDRTRAEYFMVEYRDRNDMWDSSLPAGNAGVSRKSACHANRQSWKRFRIVCVPSQQQRRHKRGSHKASHSRNGYPPHKLRAYR